MPTPLYLCQHGAWWGLNFHLSSLHQANTSERKTVIRHETRSLVPKNPRQRLIYFRGPRSFSRRSSSFWILSNLDDGNLHKVTFRAPAKLRSPSADHFDGNTPLLPSISPSLRHPTCRTSTLGRMILLLRTTISLARPSSSSTSTRTPAKRKVASAPM